MGKDRWKEIFHPENRKMQSSILLIFLLGILLLAAGRGLSSEKDENSLKQISSEENLVSERETERRMAEILSKVEGAGMVDVMLTYRQSEEKTIAREETKEVNGGDLRTEQTVILLEDGDGATGPLILTERAPVVEGVVIAAQGADSSVVATSLHQAAQVLLDVPAHKVTVLKMK